uniref:Peptidase S1 domain-containing protein n=1 Tax=Equus caballus TaxID=9796 RepID=A0A3Q2HTH2_HORSE
MSLLENSNRLPGDDYSHDLMLLQLAQPTQITAAVQVLALPTQEPVLGSTCYASGWGSIEPDKFTYPDELRCVDLTLLSNDVCDNAHSQKVTEYMLCAGHLEGGKDTCVVSEPVPPGLRSLRGRGLRFQTGCESKVGICPTFPSCSPAPMPQLPPRVPPLFPKPPSRHPCISFHIIVHPFLPLTHIFCQVQESFLAEVTSEMTPRVERSHTRILLLLCADLSAGTVLLDPAPCAEPGP